jgi:hypothetical protein
MSSNPDPGTRDWTAYNRALIERGSLTVWIDEDVLAHWSGEKDPTKRGRPFVYSDAAVELVLTLREVYHLPLRAAQGFAGSILGVLGLGLPVPHYSTLCRRAPGLGIDPGASPPPRPRVILLDSTGLKVFGEGEWKVRKHGYSKRRTWRKLHLAIDARTQEVVACLTTESGVTDASQAGALLGDVDGEVESAKADGAYDQRAVYEALGARGAAPIIPPRRNAKIHKHGNTLGPREARDENLRGVRRHGRKGWKKRVGYHDRSLAETAMSRFKAVLGERLRNRNLESQATESRVRCRVLNRITRLGLLTRAA